MIIDDWAHYLATIRDIALHKKLRTDKLTLDVLLEAAKSDNIEQALESAIADAIYEERQQPQPPFPEEGEGEPVIRMEFPR